MSASVAWICHTALPSAAKRRAPLPALLQKKRKPKNMPVEQEFNPLVTAYIFLTLAEERSKE